MQTQSCSSCARLRTLQNFGILQPTNHAASRDEYGTSGQQEELIRCAMGDRARVPEVLSRDGRPAAIEQPGNVTPHNLSTTTKRAPAAVFDLLENFLHFRRPCHILECKIYSAFNFSIICRYTAQRQIGTMSPKRRVDRY